MLLDNVKKGEERVVQRNERELNQMRSSASVQSDELAALKMRVEQIEEAIKGDEQVRKIEVEMKSEKLLAKIKERKEEAKQGPQLQQTWGKNLKLLSHQSANHLS